MKELRVKIPEDFKNEIRRRANIDGVNDGVYVMKALQEKFGWPVERIPLGNRYRPQIFINPWAPVVIDEEEDF